MAARDVETETGHGAVNIHRPGKRPRQDEAWSAEASQELLRLRFRELRGLFDDAQTVADVHEAWGVVAAAINEQETLQTQVDAVKCSDQLTKLRKLWQDSSTQLQVMMNECFSTNTMETSQRPVRSNFNRVMEEEMVQQSEDKRRRTTEKEATESDSISIQEDTTLAPEPTPQSPERTEVVLQSATSQPQEDEEFPNQDEILRLLEVRSQHLTRLAKSHQELADWTQRLMTEIVHRQNV